jgi:hypothetical protein
LPITQADISSISYTVQDLAMQTQLGTGTFVVSSSVYNSLQQNDARWTVDSQYAPNPQDRRWGYNFAAVVPAADMAIGAVQTVDFQNTVLPHKVQITVLFTPTAGEVFRQVWQVTPIAGF